jgi:hypothetical protein
LADLTSTGGLDTASVAAIDDESAPAVAEAADVVVPGPPGILAVLEWLADATSGAPRVTTRPPEWT